MAHIIAGILSLKQHLKIFQDQETPTYYFSNGCCVHCGKSGFWNHGCYFRKADRSTTGELNPVPIPRFFCPHCKKTHSVLPECIPPKRWYLWRDQQSVLSKILSGESLRTVSHSESPSLSTCKRWLNRFKALFLQHRDALCAQINELAHGVDFKGFWTRCLNHMTLDRAMFLCHQAGVCIL